MNKLINKRRNNFQKTLEAYCSCPHSTCTGCNDAPQSSSKYRTANDKKYVGVRK